MQKSTSSIISSALKRISLKNLKITSSSCISAPRINHYSTSSATLKSNNANKNNSEKDATKSLLRLLESEISTQIQLNEKLPEGVFNPQVVLEEFDDFLKENNWTLNHSERSNFVTLKRRDENLQADVTVKFDVAIVSNEMYETEEQFEEEQEDLEEDGEEHEIEASEEKEMDEEDYSVWSAIPFSVEIKRDFIPGRSLVFDCVSEGNESDSTITIENASVVPDTVELAPDAYHSPNYSQLDEDLREAFDAYVNKLVLNPADLSAFIKSYSYATEAIRYEEWLKDVKTIVSPKKN